MRCTAPVLRSRGRDGARVADFVEIGAPRRVASSCSSLTGIRRAAVLPSIPIMYSPTIKPQVAVSKSGDLLIVQGPAQPALFIPHRFVESFIDDPATSPAVLIIDVGLAAIRAVLAAEVTFDADTRISEAGQIQSATLRFRMPNNLVIGFTTDEVLAADSARIEALGIDLIVTNEAIDWQRQHTAFIGQVIGSVATVPPQLAGTILAHSKELQIQISGALQKAGIHFNTCLPHE